MPAEVEPPDRKRAVLLLSLILLVINSAATLFSPGPGGPDTVPGRPGPAMPVPGTPESPGSGRSGADPRQRLTAKQAYLLGKRIDMNTASWREISALPGISDPVARAVVEARERAGGFKGPEGLLAVRGIKERRLKKILPFLVKMGNK